MKKWSYGLAFVALVSVVAGCGTRVEEGAQPVVGQSLPQSAQSPLPSEGLPAALDQSAAATASANVATTAPGSTAVGAPSALAQAAPQSSASAGGPAKAKAAEAASGSPGSKSVTTLPPGAQPGRPGGGPEAGTPAGSAVSGPKSEVVLASVGTTTGPLGGTLLPILQGAQAWLKLQNSRGGLNGHQMRLITYDDGGDPSRHKSQVQQAVERDKAIAFFSNLEAMTGGPTVSYLEQKRIPVIGVDIGEDWVYTSPIYFPQTTSGSVVLWTGVAGAAQMLIPQGKKKFGSIVCVEVPLCENAAKVYAEGAPKEGFEHVYQGKTSFAKPEFTAECLSMRNAGVEVVTATLDPNSVGRLASSCARQGYRPIFAENSSLITDSQKTDPNLVGMVGTNPVFPWYQANTPATEEFQTAMRLYGKGVQPGVGPPTGWTSGKLLERAGANLTEPPTSEKLLQGLYAIKNDTLGGITQPLTFVPGQPAARVGCWFNMAIVDSKWTSPDNFAQHCRPYTLKAGT